MAKCTLLCISALSLIIFSLRLEADTIISTTEAAGTEILPSGTGIAVGWVLTGVIASDVTIAAELDPGHLPLSGNAYLTTGIGPGTTVASQIATTSFYVTQPADVTLFTGLTLPPGMYYLILAGTQPCLNCGWKSGEGAPPVVASGVTLLRARASKDVDPYPPATDFGFQGLPDFSVEGTLATATTTIPEPSLRISLIWATFLALGLGMGWRHAVISAIPYRQR